MSGNLNELQSIEEFNRLMDESKDRPVLIFKHSTACPVSSYAFREFLSYLDNSDPRVSYHLITVQTARAVSTEAALRLGIKHESPQAILIRNRRVIWDASHSEITASALQEAISQNSLNGRTS